MGVRLPEEYQKVEYLESSGGQYIVTDISQKSGFRAKYEIEIVSHINDTQQIFAALNVNGNAIYYPYVSGGKWYYGYGVAQNTGVSVVAHNRYIIDSVLSVGEQTVKVDDVIIASGTNTLDINLAHKMHLFASNNVQNPRYAYARIYNFTVENSQANRLVANYIPCRRKSDSKPGMYDLVSGEFLVNQGTGEFLVGPDVIDSISPLMVAWRRGLMRRKPARLPAEYQEVEYIKGINNKTYINTGVKPASDISIFGVFSFPNNIYCNLFGARSSAGWFVSMSDATAPATPAFWYNSTLIRAKLPYNDDGDWFRFTMSNINGSIFDADGVLLLSKNFNAVNFPDLDMYLFVQNQDDVPTGNGTVGCKHFVIYKSNAAVRDFIPCYRKSDSEPGMYDLITRQFLVNQGTGKFIVGPNIN